MNTGPIYEELKGLAQSHVCAQCGGELVIVWDREAQRRLCRCGQDKSHQGYAPMPSLQELASRGQLDEKLLPGTQKETEKLMAQPSHGLSRIPKDDLGSRQALSPTGVTHLVQFAEILGLKAYLGHVCLYFGQPYITVDGYYYKLRSAAPLMRIGCRPATAAERQDHQVGEKDYFYIAEAWESGIKLPTTGLGIATLAELEEKSKKDPSQWREPVAHAHPQRMAEKRAEWQLLRKLLPLGEETGE